MKRLILGLFVVFGMAVNVASAEESGLNREQKEAKRFIEWMENFKAKYPKSYNACMSDTSDSKYYYDSVCDYLFKNFVAINFDKLENGERHSVKSNWWHLVKDYGEEETKKRLLKYGMGLFGGYTGSTEYEMAEYYAKTSERR